MKTIEFDKAYFIKLGKAGEWEKSSIEEGKIRIGWVDQSLKDINEGNWTLIKRQLSERLHGEGAVTRDLNSLITICESTSDDVWITFYESKLWWCRVGENRIYEHSVSKYRKVKGRWKDTDVDGNLLLVNRIPGTISKVQGFRGTQCSVREIEDLKRLLNNQPSSEFLEISNAKNSLVRAVEKGLTKLHWKDFETLVDLVFRQSGWHRITTLGKTLKYVDLELEDPITGDLYQVQVKSKATLADFENYAKRFSDKGYRKLYFVVHSPEKRLTTYDNTGEKNIELLLPNRLAGMIVDLGLSNWLMGKIK